MDGLDEALGKVRAQTNAGTAAVRRPAVLLVAIESTLSSQSTGLTPAAYYVALLSTLNAQLEKADRDEELLEATLYLFAVIAPFVPAQSWKANKFAELVPLFDHFSASAPALKSLITIASYLPPGQVEAKPFSAVLQLTKDSRPKLRKKAQEAIKQILSRPKPPAPIHPFQQETCDWIARELQTSVKETKRGIQGADSRAIAMFTFAKNLGTTWSSASVPQVLPAILSALTLSSPHLTLSALSLLSHFFSAALEAQMEEGQVGQTLEALLQARPRSEGEQGEKLLSGWCEGVGEGCVALARRNPAAALEQAKNIFPSILAILTDARSPALLAAVSQCSSMLVAHCLPADNFDAAEPFAQTLRSALGSPMYSGPALPHVLATVKALFLRLRLRVDGQPIALKLAPFMTILDRLRDTEWRKEVEDVIATATTVCGPRWVLQQLPLNLDSGKGGRAWLLPLFKGAITNTSLEHFKSYFVPLSSTFFDRSSTAKQAGKDMEAKIWDTLLVQVFALLPGYCTHPVDPEQFDSEFLALLANIVYSNVPLRPSIFRSLELILASAETQANATAPQEVLAQFGLQASNEPLRKLKVLAKDVLGLAFNVYGSTKRGEGAYILSTITAWSAVLSKKDAASTVSSIKTLLAQALEASKGVPAQKKASEDEPIKPLHALLDILLAIASSTGSAETTRSLWDMALDEQLRTHADVGVQKKAYRLAAKVLEDNPSVAKDQVGSLMELLEDGSGASGKERAHLLELLVPLLASDELHHIPSLIPSVVLGTKESNAQTRQASFDLLLKLADKMQQGGTLHRHKVKGMEDAMAESVPGSISEFILMVSAGLAGEDPHMISATILCLARLLWEYHEQLSTEMLDELAKTMIVFLASPNREIVRSAIGFTKVAVIGLPSAVLAPHLGELMPALLGWSHEHANHFKVKVRHLIERLIRKYGLEAVDSATPAADKKLIQNTRKRMMRAKKKKAARGDSDGEAEEEDAPKPQAPTRSAYDEVLYGGSDSEISQDESDGDDDKIVPHNRKTQKRKREREERKANGVFVREEEGEVLDLLDGDMMSRVSASKQSKASRTGEQRSLASKFKTDEDGRLKFTEDDDDDDAGRTASGLPMDESGMGAYLEAMRGEDGHTRDARGRIKFNKRARGADADDDGADVVDGLTRLDVGEKSRKRAKSDKPRKKIGEEFKAKRAGGDVKKNNMQPYAYVPLSTVGGKKKGRSGGKDLDITGKRSNKKKH